MAFRLGRSPKEPSTASHELNDAVTRELQSVAKKSFTGALEVTDKADGATAVIYLLDGGVYATALSGYVPPIAARLWSSGAMDRDRSERLLNELGGNALDARAGAVAVENGWVKVETLGTMHQEFLLASVGAILALPKLKVKAASGRTTANFCTLPLPVDAVLDAVRMRLDRLEQTWESANPTCEPEYAVLTRMVDELPASITIREARALAEAANGSRTLDEIAWRLGLTRAEAVHITAVLVRAGVLALSGPAAPTAKQSLWVPEEFGRELTPAPEPVAPAAPAVAVAAAIVAHEPEPEPQPEAEAVAEPEPKPEPEPVVEAEAAADAPPEPAPEPKPAPEPEVRQSSPVVAATVVAASAASVAVKERPTAHREPIDEHVRQLRAEVAREEVSELQAALQLAVQEEMDAIAKAAAIRARLRSAEDTVAELTAGDVDG